MKTVTLTEEAYQLLCGLVHPSSVVDTEDVRAKEPVWDEVQALFPFADYVDPDQEDTSAG